MMTAYLFLRRRDAAYHDPLVPIKKKKTLREDKIIERNELLLLFIGLILLISCTNNELNVEQEEPNKIGIKEKGPHEFIKEDSLRQLVLRKDKKDSLLIFGNWEGVRNSELHLKYLGKLEGKGNDYKIMTSILLWGQSKRATNRILVYGTENIYLGNYPVSMKDELPNKIKGGKLVFEYRDNESCTKGIPREEISFTEGIPKKIHIKCRKGEDIFYKFNKTEKGYNTM